MKIVLFLKCILNFKINYGQDTVGSKDQHSLTAVTHFSHFLKKGRTFSHSVPATCQL